MVKCSISRVKGELQMLLMGNVFEQCLVVLA